MSHHANCDAAAVPSTAPDTIKRMADAASAFLASLGKDELAKATFSIRRRRTLRLALHPGRPQRSAHLRHVA